MKFGVFYPFENTKSHRELTAFKNGLEHSGITLEAYSLRQVLDGDIPDVDVAVMKGALKLNHGSGIARGQLIEHQHTTEKRVLILERGYLKPKLFWAIGWNAINGRADFCNSGSPDDRWKRYFSELMRPWRGPGKDIILCCQVPTDANVIHINIWEWCEATTKIMRIYTERHIVFRPHPRYPNVDPIPDTEWSTAPFQDDLNRAWAVVSYNSTSAAFAALSGVPVFAADRGSLAWSLALHDVTHIEHPIRPDRSQWANDLAYAQWTIEEMENGTAWEHLKEGL